MGGSREGSQRLVSVCVPAYRAEDFLAATIESVLAQSYRNWELVILDNNSPDRTGEIARSYCDPRIKVHTNDETLDLADNWNAVCDLASGDYLKVLCADDLLHPECLSQQVAILDQHQEVSLVASRRDFIGPAGDVVLRDLGLEGLIGPRPARAVVKRVIASGINPLGWPAAMLFRRDVFVAVGGFDRRWLYPLDLELAIRMLGGGSFYGTAASLASFRISPTSASSTMRRHGAQHREMMRTVAEDPRWSISRATLLRGLLWSYVETSRKFLLFWAVNSSWGPLRRLPALFLQPLRKSVGEGSQVVAIEERDQRTSGEN